MGAARPAGQHAILVLAYMRHDVGDPDAGADERDRYREAEAVHYHAMAEVVGLVRRALIFFQIRHGGRAGRRAREQRATRTKWQHTAFGFTWRWAIHDDSIRWLAQAYYHGLLPSTVEFFVGLPRGSICNNRRRQFSVISVAGLSHASGAACGRCNDASL